MWSRIKKVWALSKTPEINILTMMDEKQKSIDLAVKAIEDNEKGDGKAVFFSEPTRKDEIEYEQAENGTLPWYKRLKNL